MNKNDKKKTFEEIYKSFAKRFANDYKDDFGRKVTDEIRGAGEEGEGLYPIRRHGTNASKTPDWCQAAADSRKDYSKFTMMHMANLHNALDESGTNNAADLLRLLNVNIHISEREEKRLAIANKKADAAAHGGAGGGEDSDVGEDEGKEAARGENDVGNGPPAVAALVGRKQQHKHAEQLRLKYVNLDGQATRDEKAESDHFQFNTIHSLVPSLLFNSSEDGLNDVFANYGKASSGPAAKAQGGSSGSMSRAQQLNLKDENRLRALQDMPAIEWETYKALERSGKLLRKPPPPGKCDKDAAAGALASIAASSAKAAHTDFLKVRQDGLKTRLATLQFEFQLLHPDDDDYSARIKILREEVNSIKKDMQDSGRLLEETHLAPAPAMPARLAIPGQGRTPSSSTAVRAVLGAAPSASGSGYTTSSRSVHTPMLPTAVSSGDGNDDDDDDDDDDDEDPPDNDGNTRGKRGGNEDVDRQGTHQVTLSERQKDAIQKAAEVVNMASLERVAAEPKVCTDCQKSTDPTLPANAGIHTCHMKSCKRYVHSAVTCPHAAYADEDTGHYFCRSCIDDVSALKVLKPGLAEASSAEPPTKKRRGKGKG